MTRSIDVVIAAPHPLMLAGLRSLLEPQRDIAILSACSSYAVMLRTVKRLRPAVLVADATIIEPGDREPFARLQAVCPGLQVAVIAQWSPSRANGPTTGAGIAAILSRDVGPERLIQCVKALADGRPCTTVPARATARATREASFGKRPVAVGPAHVSRARNRAGCRKGQTKQGDRRGVRDRAWHGETAPSPDLRQARRQQPAGALQEAGRRGPAPHRALIWRRRSAWWCRCCGIPIARPPSRVIRDRGKTRSQREGRAGLGTLRGSPSARRRARFSTRSRRERERNTTAAADDSSSASAMITRTIPPRGSGSSRLAWPGRAPGRPLRSGRPPSRCSPASRRPR
jgi:DNA-binding NarL/FixJ family response regulator